LDEQSYARFRFILKNRFIVDSRWGKLKAELGLDFPVGNPLEKLYLDKPHDASGSHHRRDEEISKTRTIDSFCTSPLAKQKARNFFH